MKRQQAHGAIGLPREDGRAPRRANSRLNP